MYLKKETVIILSVLFLIVPVFAEWKYNPFTDALDYYNNVSILVNESYADETYVSKAGSTMSGDLWIQNSDPKLYFNDTDVADGYMYLYSSGNALTVYGKSGSLTWQVIQFVLSGPKVGINFLTGTPNQALEVIGNINTTGYYYGDGSNLTNVKTYNSSYDAKVDRTGDTLTGNLATSGNITADYIDANHITGDLDGSLSWTDLYDFPVSCPNGSYVTQVDNSITCTVDPQYNSSYVEYNSERNVVLDFVKVTNTGLVGYWKFDEGTGSSTASDSSGYGNTGTLTNMNTTGNSTSGWTTGYYDDGLLFDGINDIVNSTSSGSLNITTNVSISVWIKILGNSSQTTQPRIIDKRNTGTNGYAMVWDSTTNRMIIYMNSSTFTGVVNSVFTNNWYHIVLTPNSTHYVLYINGIKGSSSLAWQQVLTNDFALSIGNRQNADRTFNGTIDEVMIWNRALSENEITELYSRQFILVNPCNSTYEGNYFYNYTGHCFIGCNSTDWEQMTSCR